MWTDELNPWGAYEGSPHVAKRCWSTGETPNMVRRQRRQFGGNGDLVPAAATDGQSSLEAELLLAVNRTMAGLRRRGHALRPTAVVGRVHLDSPVLALEVDPAAVEHLLANALPLRVGDELTGVPWLRPVPARDHLDLRWHDGQVRLLGVSRDRWRAALKTLPGVPAWHEQRELVTHRGPKRLMSGVLRRLPLWKGAAWLDVVPSGHSLEIYWRGGPSSWSIAEILSNSCAALPGVSAVARGLSHSVRCVSLLGVKVAGAAESEEAWLDWLLLTFPGPATNEIAVRSDSTDLVPDLWERDDMRAALAHRDVGAVFRLLERHGVGREVVAERTGLPSHQVAAIVNGRRVETYELLDRIATGLGVPRGYMGLAFDEEVERSCDCADDERLKRRRFLQHAATITIGTAVFGEHKWVPCSCELRAHRRAISA